MSPLRSIPITIITSATLLLGCGQSDPAIGQHEQAIPQPSTTCPAPASDPGGAVRLDECTGASQAFGAAVAIDGDWAMVGDFDYDEGRGVVTIYKREAGEWSFAQRLEGAESSAFGFAVAIDGTQAAVGMPTADGGAGAIAVLGLNEQGAWTVEQELTSESYHLGISVAIDGDRLAAGMWPYSEEATGYVVLFSKTGETWEFDDWVEPTNEDDHFFGGTIALSGDRLIVGPGFTQLLLMDGMYGLMNIEHFDFAYLFERGEGQKPWQPVARLEPEALPEGSDEVQLFGASVAIEGDTAVVGQGVTFPDGVGAVHVYGRTEEGWSKTQTLTAGATAHPMDFFGGTVAMDGDRLAVGSPVRVVGEMEVAGAIFVFERSEGQWSHVSHHAAWQPSPLFGISIDVSGSDVIAGSSTIFIDPDDEGDDSDGRVYINPTEVKFAGEACTSTDFPEFGYCAKGISCKTECGGGCAACAALGSESPGTCGAANKGMICRGATGPCDAAEACDGEALSCPANKLMFKGVLCRAASGPCDRPEVCSGNSSSCPVDTGALPGTVCRAATGPCDADEVCDGKSFGCPEDGKLAAGTVCRSSSGPCDAAEACDGSTSSCPDNVLHGAETICRQPQGACDVAERCDGSAATCPEDVYKPSGQICRMPVGPGDSPERCDGNKPACPEVRDSRPPKSDPPPPEAVKMPGGGFEPTFIVGHLPFHLLSQK